MDCARIAVDEGEFDLIVLDEVNNAMCLGLVAVEEVLDMLHRRPAGVEIVLTGRQAPQAVIDAADYVTEMRLIKHPYDSGIPARKGVDF
jgi:cob(I)alamin adenosyltransferase